MWLENQGGWGVETQLEGRPFRLIDAPGRERSRPDEWEIRGRLGEACRCHMEAPLCGLSRVSSYTCRSSGRPVVLLFLIYRW